MREIKFRGWDKKNNTMINHNRFFRLDCSNEEPFLALLENKSFDMEVDIMQYTGLKDCNGVEIYEGDIIEIEEDMNVYGADYGIKKHYSEVYYDKYGFMPFLEMGIYEKFQVLGNKYENKNLLDELQGNEIEEE